MLAQATRRYSALAWLTWKTRLGSAPVNSTSPLRYQSKSGLTSSEGSAMNPSSDIDACMTTLLMLVLPPRAGRFTGGCHLGGFAGRPRLRRMVVTPAGSAVREPALIEDARRGEDHAFGRLVEPYRPELLAHCYRLLGSVHDADDALQDALLRAWRGLPRFDGRRPLRPWLYKIATNVCLDLIARRPRRWLPVDYGPPRGDGPEQPRPVWVEPYPDQQLGLPDGYASPEARYEQREAVELAFIAALQHLPAQQRAVLVLRDVLGFSATEAATVLETTPTSVRSALQRARQTIRARLPSQSQQEAMRSLGDRRLRALAQRLTDALEAGQVEVIVGLLAEDATFAMPPHPNWCRGRDALSRSWLMPAGSPTGLRYLPARANGQLALGAYKLGPQQGCYLPVALDVLSWQGTRVSAITAFRTPEVFPRFGLPAKLPQEPGTPARHR
jgi:RNA polymerase sigma-70 factor (ECF subfamily)